MNTDRDSFTRLSAISCRANTDKGKKYFLLKIMQIDIVYLLAATQKKLVQVAHKNNVSDKK